MITSDCKSMIMKPQVLMISNCNLENIFTETPPGRSSVSVLGIKQEHAAPQGSPAYSVLLDNLF